MHRQTLADELAEIRAALAQLQQREGHLREALYRADGTPAPLRPGWPIRRITDLVENALH